MLTHVMRLEWRNLRADGTLSLVVALFAGFIGFGVLNGTAWSRAQERTMRAIQAEEQRTRADLERNLAEGVRGSARPEARSDPGNPGAVGRSLGRSYAVLPPSLLAPLAVGQTDLHPSYFRVTTDGKEAFASQEELENPLNLLTGRFDLAFALVFLMPLLILALGYNVLSGEKEDGTLAMTLSQPVALGTVALGKVTLRAMVVLLLSVGFALIAALIGGVSLTTEGVGARLLPWVGVIVAYSAFWFAAAFAVNAVGRGSATNAIILAGLWLALVVLIPTLIHVAVTTLHPVPSRIELIQSVREASTEAVQQGSRLLAGYYEDHPEYAPRDGKPDPGDFSLRQLARQDLVERRIQPVLERHEAQLARQQALVDRLRYLSPAIVAQEALHDAVGRGAPRYHHFLEQVARFHSGYRAFFVPRAFHGERLTATDYAAIPRFRYQEEPGSAVASRVVPAILALAVPALVIATFALAALRRYPVVG
jgi:ABC-2 type transport system permease protein